MATPNRTSQIIQSYTLSAVGERTGSTSSFSDILGNSDTSPQLGFSNSTNTALQFAGSVATATANDNIFHAMNAIYNGASSTFYIDGSSNSVSAGTDPITSANAFNLGTGNNALTGNIAEVGVWSSAFSGGQLSSMNSNQHSYWGF